MHGASSLQILPASNIFYRIISTLNYLLLLFDILDLNIAIRYAALHRVYKKYRKHRTF